MMEGDWTDDEIIAKLYQDFSSLSTMNRAREELKSLYQDQEEPITVFIYKYSQMHYLSTGTKAERETHPFAITGFIAALEPQLNRVVAKKYTDARNKPHTLQDVFQLAEYCSRKMQEASSLDRGTSINLSSSVNKISSAEVNEVLQGCWNNYRSNNYGNRSPGVSRTITRERKFLTGNHGTIRTKSHGTRITNFKITKSQNQRMHALQVLKM